MELKTAEISPMPGSGSDWLTAACVALRPSDSGLLSASVGGATDESTSWPDANIDDTPGCMRSRTGEKNEDGANAVDASSTISNRPVRKARPRQGSRDPAGSTD